MLPDFPETKSKIQHFMTLYMRQQTSQANPFLQSGVRKSFVCEGDRMRIERADSSVSQTPFVEVSSETQIKTSDIKNHTFQDLFDLQSKMALDIAQQQTVHVNQELINSLDSAGQTTGAKGKPLCWDNILDAIEKMHVEFNPETKEPEKITLMGGALTSEKLKELDEEYKSNPKIEKRHNEILLKKKEEWRAREADRKLVG